MNFKNFSEIIEFNGKEYPQKMFCIEYSTGRKVTYSKFDSQVNQCCNFLEAHSLAKGDIISVCIKNSYAFIVIYFACLRLNAAVNPLPSSLSYQEIRKSLEFLSSKMIFIDDQHQDKDFSFISQTFFMSNKYNSFFDELSRHASRYTNSVDEENAACYYYTSGTISNPKCIMYSHKNMVSLIGSMTRSFHFCFGDIHLGILPLGHTAITNYTLLPVIYNASTLILCESLMKIRSDFWKIVSKNNVSYVEMVPTSLFMILNTPYERSDIEGNSTLKYIGCGSAPLAVDVQKKFQERFSIPVINLYGLSETGPTHYDDPFSEDWQPGSIGRPIDVCECINFRKDKTEADIDEIGEIAIKGENVFMGYYKNGEAYEKVMCNGYFLTGDLGYKDARGIFYFVGRKKDLIIKGGVNISSAEIEEVLYQINEIQIAAVIGVPDIIFGEEIVAFVKLKDGFLIEEGDIRSYCVKNLQVLKCPKGIYIVENVPLGPSGKILKRKLKENYKRGYYGKK